MTHPERPARTPVDGWRASLQIAAKDLRVCLRDRQTVIYAVVLPLAMYPILFRPWTERALDRLASWSGREPQHEG